MQPLIMDLCCADPHHISLPPDHSPVAYLPTPASQRCPELQTPPCSPALQKCLLTNNPDQHHHPHCFPALLQNRPFSLCLRIRHLHIQTSPHSCLSSPPCPQHHHSPSPCPCALTIPSISPMYQCPGTSYPAPSPPFHSVHSHPRASAPPQPSLYVPSNPPCFSPINHLSLLLSWNISPFFPSASNSVRSSGHPLPGGSHDLSCTLICTGNGERQYLEMQQSRMCHLTL